MITNFIKEVKKFFEEVYKTDLKTLSLQELKELNDKMTAFYADPLVCKNETENDKLCSTIIMYILSCYSHFVRKTENADTYMTFINDIASVMPEDMEKAKSITLSLLSEVSRPVSSVIKHVTVIENPEREIVLKADLDSYNYLYYYGENITENQLKIVDFFNKTDDETITGMAQCTIDAFLRGLKNTGIDASKKGYLSLVYPIGFEKVARKIQQLLDGKMEVIFNTDSISFNKQVDYNHRYDYNLYITQDYVDSYLSTFEESLGDVEERLTAYAGPIYIDSFGEKRFVPENGHEIYKKSEEIAKMSSDFSTKYSNMYLKHIRKDTSFCIISYPCPEIGDNFEEIFKETIHINTLDNAKYQRIHQNIIDVLDTAKTVHITGKNGNKTDLVVALTEIADPEKETIFENCCADVNVPVGEVFTSPKLTGTNGVLHVSEIYLNKWKFENLTLQIKDGFIGKYSCSNYPTEKENTEYINEHLLFDHPTLPMGEFAIGTNTYAYVMGNKYNINDKLDILIAEKTGPHFAFGDTCFSQEEHIDTFNPDGKKIIAKDNEVSIKRLSDNADEQSKAYFGCHTDITIPYAELGDIIAIQNDGTEVTIIQDGKFVLSGTEELNIEGM